MRVLNENVISSLPKNQVALLKGDLNSVRGSPVTLGFPSPGICLRCAPRDTPQERPPVLHLTGEG